MRIGPYRIVRRLGEGGLGEVFLAMRDGSNQPVALKRMRSQVVSPDALSRFKREAHIASMIDHPNVARLFDAGEIEGDFVVVTEFVCGKEIEELIRGASEKALSIPIELAVGLVAMVLDALTSIHSLKDPEGKRIEIVHRDLAPKNLMVTFDGDVKLIDFGITRGKVDSFRTRAGAIVGTPTHLSPEQATGEPVDARSDIYTVSVVLHELLTGQRLVNSKNIVDAIHKVVVEEAPPPSRSNPSVTPELDRAVARGLSKDIRHRWQTARDLRDAVLAAAPGAWDRAQIASFMQSTFVQDAEIVLDAEPADTMLATRTSVDTSARIPRPKQRSRAAIAGVVLLASALALVAIARTVAQETPPPPLRVVEQTTPPVPTIAARTPIEEEEIEQVPLVAPPPLKTPAKKPVQRSEPSPPPPVDRFAVELEEMKSGFDIDRAERWLEKLDMEAPREATGIIDRAKRCLSVCNTDGEKINALSAALKEVRAKRRPER